MPTTQSKVLYTQATGKQVRVYILNLLVVLDTLFSMRNRLFTSGEITPRDPSMKQGNPSINHVPKLNDDSMTLNARPIVGETYLSANQRNALKAEYLGCTSDSRESLLVYRTYRYCSSDMSTTKQPTSILRDQQHKPT